MHLKVQNILHNINQVTRHYPLVLLSAFVMSASVVNSIDLDSAYSHSQYILTKIILVSALGISLLFGLKMISQRLKKGLYLRLIGLVFLIGFYFILPKSRDDFTSMYLFLFAPMYVLSHLLVSVGPFLNRKNPEQSFWQYNKSLFVNFFLTAVFTLVLTGGIELAIWAIDTLFHTHFNGDLYGKVFFVLLIFGGTLIFLLFVKDGLPHLKRKTPYPAVLKFFTQFILIPLLLIYVVILYAYSVKILGRWELPRGWVVYLVLAYSVLGILAVLLVHPLKVADAKSWVKIFSNIFYYTLIPLIVLLFVAIFTRISEYGYTEARYFVVLLAVWLTIIVGYFILYKKATIKFIPISLFVMGALALTLPYFNAFAVARRSQKKSLEKLLTQHHLLRNGQINFDLTITDTVMSALSNKFNYLQSRHQNDYLMAFIPDKEKADFDSTDFWFFSGEFAKVQLTNTGNDYKLGRSLSANPVASIAGYQYVVKENDLNDNNGVTINGDTFLLNNNSGNLTLSLNDRQSLDLMPKVKSLFGQFKGRKDIQNIKNLSVEGDIGKYHVKVLFEDINRYGSGLHNSDFNFYNSLFLFKLKADSVGYR